MATQLVIVEQQNDWQPHFPGVSVVTAKEYLSQQEYLRLKDARIISLCRSYRYLGLGYYCSLLAEARRHKIIPSDRTITDLSSKSIYSLNIEDLDAIIQHSWKKRREDCSQTTFEFKIFFGQCEDQDFQELSRQLFDMFRCPILKVGFTCQGMWQISTIKPGYIQNITSEEHSLFIKAFNAYVTKRWQPPKTKPIARYDLAILYNPTEKLPPSNKRALQKFVTVGKKLGLEVDLIEKKDLVLP